MEQLGPVGKSFVGSDNRTGLFVPVGNRFVICDPRRNKLLSEGPKTDKIDAAKLVQLLKAGLVKEVYHSTDKYINLCCEFFLLPVLTRPIQPDSAISSSRS